MDSPFVDICDTHVKRKDGHKMYFTLYVFYTAQINPKLPLVGTNQDIKIV